MELVTTQEGKLRIQAFMRTVTMLSNNKLFFNKPFVKQLSVMEQCFELSRNLLGKDFNFLQDGVGVRLYIRDVFGVKALSLFEDAYGEIQLDIEHALLFYYTLLHWSKTRDINMEAAEGVFHFIAGHQLDDEFAQISKVSPKGRISPIFELHAQLFKWKRCPFILRKYMLNLSLPEGYEGFYFEKPYMVQLAYLLHQNMSYDDAENLLKNSESGLFFSHLPLEVENYILADALSGGFDPSLMDGYYAPSFVKSSALISTVYTLDATYNVYNHFVKPAMIELMGMLVADVNSEVQNNRSLQVDDFLIYHLSPHRLAVAVKQGLSLADALPSLHQAFNPIPAFDLSRTLTGEFL